MDNVKQKSTVLQATEGKEAEVAKEQKYGLVFGCDYLNIRKIPNKESTSVHIIPAGTKLEIVDDSDSKFYKVYDETRNITGFCMKQYIKLS